MTRKIKWKIDLSKAARKDMKALDKSIQKRIYDFLKERVAPLEDPRQLGEPLHYHLKGIWRYKIAKDYRVLCEIHDDQLLILAVEIGHRKNVYVTKH